MLDLLKFTLSIPFHLTKILATGLKFTTVIILSQLLVLFLFGALLVLESTVNYLKSLIGKDKRRK